MHHARLLPLSTTRGRGTAAGLLQPEFDVMAEVQDGLAPVLAAEQLSRDVIVSDISLLGLDGIAAATLILRRSPSAPIVFVTVHGDPQLMERGFEIGALGYVRKG
jgi:DNA-binding NarL/FixJ family response regulator